jgi:WXG100 family type VII secretion target
MTNASFGTEMATMKTTANHVRDVNTQIDSSLRSLLSKLEALYSTWQGQGASSFHVLKDRWNDSTNRLNKSLEGISIAIDKTADQYRQSEEASDTGFKGVAGNL